MDIIELRSEKVRKIIRNIPSGAICYGICIVICILGVLFTICWHIPYEGHKNIFEYCISTSHDRDDMK